jgi:hypothetical protein
MWVMKRLNFRNIGVFMLGMLVFAIGSLFYSTFIDVKRPESAIVVENRGEMCFQIDDQGNMMASVKPEGCFSTTCTRPVQQVGKVMVDRRDFKIRFETRFVLAETSRFPLPCIENCAGGGRLDFNLGVLEVGDHSLWHGGIGIGKLKVFSGLPTPRQCFPE